MYMYNIYIIVSFLYFVTNVTFCFTRDVTRLWPATPLPDRQIYRLMYDSVVRFLNNAGPGTAAMRQDSAFSSQ